MGIHIQRTDVIVRDRAPINGNPEDKVEYSGQFYLDTKGYKLYYGIVTDSMNQWVQLSANIGANNGFAKSPFVA